MKIYESFTNLTLKIIYLLTSFYTESYIYKPYFSRSSSSEKYLICKNFKFDNKKVKNKIKVLENILNQINKLESTQHINDIFPKLVLPEEFVNHIKFINIQIANKQQITINNIIKYIKENNYFGEKYHNYQITQIKNTQWWISIFYPENKNKLVENKKNFDKNIKEQIKFNKLELNEFNK